MVLSLTTYDIELAEVKGPGRTAMQTRRIANNCVNHKEWRFVIEFVKEDSIMASILKF